MPTWKDSLTDDQRWMVIRYIQQIFARPVERDPAEGDPTGAYANLTNPVPLTVDTLEEGKTIFIRECMVCHGDAGTGHGPYRQGLFPQPPDFSDKQHYNSFTDSDYFWRISEGLPWSAMPAWKLEYPEEDRWKVVHYLRVNFTQTEPRPTNQPSQVYPENYLSQTMPKTVPVTEINQGYLPEPQPVTPSFSNGKAMYAQMCAHCHGLTGVGDGWDGKYLDVSPANFTGEMVRGLSDGDWFARVSLGIQNSAMPTWGEFMPIEYRWDVIKYIQDGIVANTPGQVAPGQSPGIIPSVSDNGAIAADFLTLSRANWIEEGHTISETHGADLYKQYCQECHGDKGQGKGPGTLDHGISSPAPFPPAMEEAYIYWRIWKGVPDTLMPPFEVVLKQADVWDLTTYIETLPGQKPPSGGG
jgi:mono/diheme cytochrome c family protein